VRLPAAAAVLGLVLAWSGADGAQTRDLSALTGPIEGLTRDQLDAVVTERWACREMVAHLYELSHAFSLAAAGGPRNEFQRLYDGAGTAWRFARGTCDQSIASVGDGWPRSVMESEFQLVQRLRAALMEATTAFSENRPADDVNRALDGYEAMLGEWVTWLELSGRFWAGELLPSIDRSCLARCRGKAADLRGRLWLLALTEGARDTSELRVRLDQLRRDVDECEATDALGRVEHRLLQQTLLAYGDALAGLGEGDDRAAARAMEREQELASRAARCRGEHAAGDVSEDCSGGEPPVDGGQP